MDKLKRVILLVSLIFLTVCIVGFAFPNEPDGFRDLKWGDAPTEDMKLENEWMLNNTLPSEYWDNARIYRRNNENDQIGSAKLYWIEYHFNFRSNQLFKVTASFSNRKNFEILKIIFEDRFGEPTKEEKNFLLWNGEKAKVHLIYFENGGDMEFRSWEIKPEEPPEIDKIAEIEKAKDDF
jgi:hypothetical protein